MPVAAPPPPPPAPDPNPAPATEGASTSELEVTAASLPEDSIVGCLHMFVQLSDLLDSLQDALEDEVGLDSHTPSTFASFPEGKGAANNGADGSKPINPPLLPHFHEEKKAKLPKQASPFKR